MVAADHDAANNPIEPSTRLIFTVIPEFSTPSWMVIILNVVADTGLLSISKDKTFSMTVCPVGTCM